MDDDMSRLLRERDSLQAELAGLGATIDISRREIIQL